MTTHLLFWSFLQRTGALLWNLSPESSLISNPVYNKKEYQDLICSFATVSLPKYLDFSRSLPEDAVQPHMVGAQETIFIRFLTNRSKQAHVLIHAIEDPVQYGIARSTTP